MKKTVKTAEEKNREHGVETPVPPIDMNNVPTLEQLRDSDRRYRQRYDGDVAADKTDDQFRRDYAEKMRVLNAIANPSDINELITSISFTPEKQMKIVPNQIMPYQDAARLLNAALHHFIGLDRREMIMNGNKKQVYRMIAQYICCDPDFEKENVGFDLNKGLFIYGKIGTGKSILFNALELIFKKMNFHYHKFQRISCKKILLKVDEEKKISAINPFLSGQWMFDDLGHEKNMFKFYGNTVNLMEDIMTERYNLFVDTGMKTHITSNLSIENPDEIRSLYGERIRDRFNQMFNFIYMGGESLRR